MGNEATSLECITVDNLAGRALRAMCQWFDEQRTLPAYVDLQAVARHRNLITNPADIRPAVNQLRQALVGVASVESHGGRERLYLRLIMPNTFFKILEDLEIPHRRWWGLFKS